MKSEQIEAQKELFSEKKSMAQKYADLIVGRRGFWSLLKYEFILLTSPLPGVAGLWLRSRLYPKLLGRCGRNVIFGANVVLRHPSRIEIGDNVVIDDNCLLDAKGNEGSGIRIGNGVFLGRNSILSCKNGDIVLGDNVNIGFNCEVFSGSSVTLEEDTLVAAYCYFIGGGHDFDDPEVSVLKQKRSSKGISAGAGSWFGAGCKILDGVSVGRHAVVGAGAVVSRDVPEFAIAAGVPAKIVRDRRKGS